MNQPAIDLEEVKKTYGKGVQALRCISLKVDPGIKVSLLGPNGAGKSTLIGVMTGLIRPDRGRVRVCGVDPIMESTALQARLGVMSQTNDLDPQATVMDHLVFQGRIFGLSRKTARGKAEELIHAFSLEGERSKKAKALSGGNQRKLHCALAMVHDPEILFLDEPTVGMDPIGRARFWLTIDSYQNRTGASMILTTQYLEEADRHTDRMVLLIEGQVHYEGKISAFKTKVQASPEGSLEDRYVEWVQEMESHQGCIGRGDAL